MYLGVAQLVARYLGVVEAAGSSPVTQIKKQGRESVPVLYLRELLAKQSRNTVDFAYY